MRSLVSLTTKMDFATPFLPLLASVLRDAFSSFGFRVITAGYTLGQMATALWNLGDEPPGVWEKVDIGDVYPQNPFWSTTWGAK